MAVDPFLNAERQLRNGWRIVIFFVVLASLLVPTLINAQRNSSEVSIGMQAILIMFTSLACQLLRRKPLAELLGQFNVRWLMELGLGGLIGCAIMVIPALILRIFGLVSFQWNPISISALKSSLLLFAGVAITEELLFRGFVFPTTAPGIGTMASPTDYSRLFPAYTLEQPGYDRGYQDYGRREYFCCIDSVRSGFYSNEKPGNASWAALDGELDPGGHPWFWRERQ